MSWPAPPQDAALHGPAGEFVCHTRPAHRIRITRPASGRSGTRRRHRGRHPQPLPVVDRTKVPHPRQRPGSPPLHKPRPHPSRPHPPSLHPRPEAHRLKAAPPNYVPPTAFASTVQFPSSFTCQRQQSPVLAARLHHRVNLTRDMSHATYRPVGGSPAGRGGGGGGVGGGSGGGGGGGETGGETRGAGGPGVAWAGGAHEHHGSDRPFEARGPLGGWRKSFTMARRRAGSRKKGARASAPRAGRSSAAGEGGQEVHPPPLPPPWSVATTTTGPPPRPDGHSGRCTCPEPPKGFGGHRRDASHVHSYAGRQGRRPAVPRGHRRELPQHGPRPRPTEQQTVGRDGPRTETGARAPPTAHSRQFRGCS